MSGKAKGQREGSVMGDPKDLDPDDLFGLGDEIETIRFQCVECGCVDPVPEFVVDEFTLGLEDGEKVEMCCPRCNGAMRRAREETED